MHNLHIVRVNAENGDEAVSIVNDFLDDTISNRFDFYNITSAIDEKGNVVYKDEEGRFSDLASLSAIKELLSDKYKRGELDYQKNVDLLNKYIKEKNWSGVAITAEYLDRHYCLARQIENGEFDPFKIVLNDFDYDMFGITDISQYASESEKVFLVLVDFHN